MRALKTGSRPSRRKPAATRHASNGRHRLLGRRLQSRAGHERSNRVKAKRRPAVAAYLRIAGPWKVTLTHRLGAGEEAGLWATAWAGRHRRFPSFDFTSSCPTVARVVAHGQDWATVKGVSEGWTTITAAADNAAASLRLKVARSS